MEYVRLGFAELEVPPSPNIHDLLAIEPSESELPLELNETVSGATPVVGLADILAFGAWLAGALTCILTVVESVAPSLSVTVNLAV